MKRSAITLFLTFYVIFIPFVTVNCGKSDTPFAPSASVNAISTEEACLAQTYITEDCVDVIQAHEEQVASEEAQVTSAARSIYDFQQCADMIESDGTAAADAVYQACADLIEAEVQAYQICEPLATDDAYTYCDDVLAAVSDLVAECDADSEAVSATFCSLLTS